MMNILRNVTEIVLREARMIGWSFPLQLFPAGPAGQSWAEQSYQGPHIAHLDLQGPHIDGFDLQALTMVILTFKFKVNALRLIFRPSQSS